MFSGRPFWGIISIVRKTERRHVLKLFRNTSDDLTRGKLFPSIVKFILPLILTNLLQTLYNAADMIVVGFSDVEGALGSIGTTGAMVGLIVNLFMGFSIGTMFVVARNIGSGDDDAVSQAVHSSVLIGIVSGVVCAVLGIFVSRPILILLGDEGHILDLATKYTVIYFAGVPFISLTNYLIAVFRAKGNTITPLVVLSATGLLNVGLNFFFVLALGMDVDGVALATGISNAVSAVVLLVLLAKVDGACRFYFRKLRFEKQSVKDIIIVGLPAGIQGVLFSVSNMVTQSSIIYMNNTLCPGGSQVIDGNTAANNLEVFAYLSQNAVAQAAVTFTGQHLGARKYRRIRKVMLDCYLASAAVAVFSAMLIYVFRRPLISLYHVSGELALKTAFTRMNYLLLPYLTLSFMDTGSGILRGLGKSTTSTVISLIGTCVLRVAWIYTVFEAVKTLDAIYVIYPLSWTVTGIVFFVFSCIILRKLIRGQEQSGEGALPEGA